MKKALSSRYNNKSHWATSKQAPSRGKSLEIADTAGKNWNNLFCLFLAAFVQKYESWKPARLQNLFLSRQEVQKSMILLA